MSTKSVVPTEEFGEIAQIIGDLVHG